MTILIYFRFDIEELPVFHRAGHEEPSPQIERLPVTRRHLFL